MSFFNQPPNRIDVVIEASGVVNNINRVFRQVNAGGRIVLLARSGEPLVIDATDHMITNAISLLGSRGHLCGAFNKILALYEQGRLPLGAIVTSVVNGLSELQALLQSTEKITAQNCKVLVKF